MCGLAGALWRGARQADWQQVGKDMAQRIRHRGPDSHGVWCDPRRAFCCRMCVCQLSIYLVGYINQCIRHVVVMCWSSMVKSIIIRPLRAFESRAGVSWAF